MVRALSELRRIDPRRGGAQDSRAGRRVLVAVGQEALRATVDLALRHCGYLCRFEESVERVRAAITEWKPHLLVLDIDLEVGAGLQLIDERRCGPPIGIIVLTRSNDLGRKLDAFERGADDYIGLPFIPDDLIARARAVLRRIHGSAEQLIPRLAIAGLEIDVLNRTVRAGDHEVHLTSLEYSLLYLLAANRGVALTRDQILAAIWGTESACSSNVIDAHVRSLRSKLQDDWHTPRYIETLPGLGYRFVDLPRAG